MPTSAPSLEPSSPQTKTQFASILLTSLFSPNAELKAILERDPSVSKARELQSFIKKYTLPDNSVSCDPCLITEATAAIKATQQALKKWEEEEEEGMLFRMD